MSARRRAVLLLGLALALGALAAADVRGREHELATALGPQVPVVVATRDIAAGAQIAGAALAVRRTPVRYAPDGAFSTASQVAGRRAAVDIPRGADLATPLVQADGDAGGLTASMRPGERVAPLVAVGDPATISVGGRVDVVVTRDDGAGGAGVTRLALEDAEVLMVRPAAAEPGASDLPRVALQLRVTVHQAVYLAAAQSFAREVRVLPRPADDRRRVADGIEVRDGL